MGRYLTAVLAVATAGTFVFFILAMMPSSPISSLRERVGPTAFDPLVAIFLSTLILVTFFAAEAPRLEASKEIALVSMLVALGAAGRILFVAAPNVSPVDWLTLCTGIVFGPVTGFTVGAATMLVSNFWLGQGPWTIYQMVAMGSLGIIGGLLGRWRSVIGRKTLAAIGLAWGFIYGIITSFFWMLMVSSAISWTSFTAYWASGMAFYVLQGVGNAVLLLLLGRRTLQVFERFRQKLSVRFEEDDVDIGGVSLDL